MQKKPWFRHDHDASSDEKLEMLAVDHGFCGIGRWWNLVEYLRGLDGYRLRLTDFTPTLLAKRWMTAREPCSPQDAQALLDAMVDRYQLLKRADGEVWSESLCARMAEYEARGEQLRIAGKASAAIRKQKYGSARPNTVRTAGELRSNIRSDDVQASTNEGIELIEGRKEGRGGAGGKPSDGRESPPSSAAAALTAAPPSVGDVLPSLTKINPRAEIPSDDEPAFAALLAVHGAEAVVAAYAVYQRLNPGRRMHWFVADFAKYHDRAEAEQPVSIPLPPSMEERRAEREREEQEHPELLAEAQAKAEALKAKMHRKAPSTDADDWEATAPGAGDANAVVDR